MTDMWFGNKQHMMWIPCPAVGADYTRRGSSRSTGLLNGGLAQKTSLSGAKAFDLSWSRASRDDLRPITDFAEGVYGPGPFYWADPFTMNKNVLAQSFATPSLGGYDGVVLNGADYRPELTPTSANSLGYPAESAIYTMTLTDEPLRHFVPIPPGFTAWVGFHGVAGTGGKVQVHPVVAPGVSGSAVDLTPLSVTSSTRFNASFDSDDNFGIEIALGGDGSVTISGIMVQLLPTGATPAAGGFISGQGHSGCTFENHPSLEAYSVAFDLVGMSATLVETEQWR